MDALEILLDKASQGKGALAFITGEAGIGKTRLSSEASKRAEERGFVCLVAKSPKGGSLLPYSVWVSCLRELVSTLSMASFLEACGSQAPLMVSLLPELEALRMGILAVPPAAGGTTWQVGNSPLRIFNAVSQFFFRLSASKPVLIILDDSQWADKSSIDLLNYAASNGLNDHRVMVLSMSRDTPDSENFDLEALISSSGNVIKLERFDPSGATELIRKTPGCENVPEATCRVLQKKTGGNPLFMKEMLTLLIEKASKSSTASMLLSPEGLSLEIPDTVEQVVRRRLAQLDDKLVEALRVAAIVGQEFDARTLSQASVDLDETRVSHLMKAAVAAGIVRRKQDTNGGAYSFADEISMDVLVEDLSQETLRDYHLSIGGILEKQFGRQNKESAAEIAYHYYKGQDWSKCFNYSIIAGDFATSRFAHEEALNQYSIAVSILGKMSKSVRKHNAGEVLEKKGNSLHQLFREEAAESAHQEALKAYRETGQLERAASLELGMAVMITISSGKKGGELKALDYFNSALAFYRTRPKGLSLAWNYIYLATWHWYFGDLRKGREYCQEAIDLARDIDAPLIGAYANVTLAILSPATDLEVAKVLIKKSEQYLTRLQNQDRIDQRGGLLEGVHPASVADGGTMHLKWRLGIAYYAVAPVTSKAVEYFLSGYEDSKLISEMPSVYYLLASAALFGDLLAGKWNEARDEVRDALHWPNLDSVPGIASWTYATVGNVSLRSGDLSEAETMLTKAYNAFQDMPFRPGFFFSLILGSMARLYMDRRDYSRAEMYLRDAYARSMERELILSEAWPFAKTLTLLVELNEKRGRREQAMEALGELRNLSKLAKQDWVQALCFEGEGILASGGEDWERAAHEYEQAGECWKRLGFPYELAHSYQSVAEANQNLGNPELANILFSKASGIFRGLGAKRDVEKVELAAAAAAENPALTVMRLRGSAKQSSKAIFDYLASAFISDYYSNRLAPEASGWRSLVDIARNTKIPLSSFYKNDSKQIGGIGELERMGLVETKIFPGKRGRGGMATRARIAYHRDEIQKFISKKVARGSSNHE